MTDAPHEHASTTPTAASDVSPRKKARRLTSWQRKKKTRSAEDTKETQKAASDATSEATLNRLCAEKKAASHGARERYRLGQRPLPGDKELVDEYHTARENMARYHAKRRATSDVAAPISGKRRLHEPSSSSHNGVAPAADMAKRAKAEVTEPPSAPTPLLAEAVMEARPAAGKGADASAEGREGAAAAAGASVENESTAAHRRANVCAEVGEKKEEQVVHEVVDGKWTCSVCNVTIHVRSDGRAREQHLSGKAHARKARVLQTAVSASAASQEKAALRFDCRLCGCSVASSAREAHVTGAKHLERVAALHALCKSESFKKGDWLCCDRKHALQHNYAKSATCRRGFCGGTRELGIPYEDATQLARTL